MRPVGIIAICLAAFFWALEGVILTPRLAGLDAAYVVLIVQLMTFALFAMFFFKEFRKIREFKKSDYIYFTLVGLFGGSLGTVAIVKALFLVNFQNLSVVVLLQQLQPIFAIVLAMMMLHEKPDKKFYPWAAVAMIASYFMVFGLSTPNWNTGPNTIIAALLALVAAASWGSSTVLGRKLAVQHQPRTMAFYRAGFTMLIMIIYVTAMGKWNQPATTMNWIVMLLIAVLSGMTSMVIYYYGLRRVPASYATIAEMFMPVSAIILDFTINKSRLSAVQLIAAAVMILAIRSISRLKAKA